VSAKLKTITPQNIAVCSVVKAELFHGAMKSNNPSRSLSIQQLFLGQFQSLPFDDGAAEFYGSVKSTLEKSGTPIAQTI
jgi:tRNA(fMet)-specific endonuclease VapC